MCIACIEYIKGTLRLSEYKTALRETLIDGDKAHVEQLQTIMYDHDGDEDDLKNKVKNLNPTAPSS